MKETQQTAIVPTTETTAGTISEPTARLVEKSFTENTLRNRRQALQHFQEWLQRRTITDGPLAEYITHLFDQDQATKTISGMSNHLSVDNSLCSSGAIYL